MENQHDPAFASALARGHRACLCRCCPGRFRRGHEDSMSKDKGMTKETMSKDGMSKDHVSKDKMSK
jgi:hypothetical protein